MSEGLHPFRPRATPFEPVLTTSQLLTPAQKQHLGEQDTREKLLGHLHSHHGQTFTDLKESDLSHPIDPQVKRRFGLPDRPLTSDQTLRLRHLQEHIENLEERIRTSPPGFRQRLEKEAGLHGRDDPNLPKGINDMEKEHPKGISDMERGK